MQRFDVVVIGSGALGSSAAFHLARRGQSVALVDQAAIGSQTSPRAAGLSGQVRRNPVMAALARRSVEKIQRFTAETGQPMTYHQPGSMNVARTERHKVQLEKTAAYGRSLGFDIDLISPGEAHERMPFLQTSGVLAVTHMRTDVFLEPWQIPTGYARASQALGAVTMPDTQVLSLVVEDGAVARVVTDKGELAADAVVDAAGGWTRLVAAMAGAVTPMVPMRHQLMVTEPIPGVSNNQPIVRIIDTNVYVRPDRGGLMLGGYERDPTPVDLTKAGPGFRIENLALDLDVLRRLAADVEAQFPIFQTAPLREHRGGLPTMTPDGEHIVGPAPGVKGLYILGGCNVGGLSISPALGEELARWIVTGAPSVDLSRMSPARFTTELSASDLFEACKARYANYYSPPATVGAAY
ncbi:NAD(P)/FAD-dependent oxidoreductase [Caulobacter sp. KR2-114]|uniref:NAD(P)/FAD-dependent oxidoreductase n=1 Tax=Caulobacter sp. KR2-114 TaxID=3400912 RepID=UPI003C0977D2